MRNRSRRIGVSSSLQGGDEPPRYGAGSLRALRAAGLVALVAASWTAPADAQAPAPEISAADKELARRLMDEADKAFEGARFPESVQKYCQADKIMGVPTTALECGKALEKMTKLLDAKEAYLRGARYQHPAGQKEPDAFVTARATAQQKADALSPRIPELIISVVGADEGTAITIKVDGEPLRTDIPRRLVNPAPNEHLVSATAPGYNDASVTVSAKEGEQKPVTLTLEKGGRTALPAIPTATPSAKPPEVPLEPDKKGGGVPLAAMVGFGIGAAGLITGAITGGVSLAQTSGLKKDCEAAKGTLDACPASVADAQARHDKALALANASNVTLAIGGAGVIFGVIALFAFKPSEPKTGAFIAPLVGPTSLGLHGAF